jgi:hypothetical protein
MASPIIAAAASGASRTFEDHAAMGIDIRREPPAALDEYARVPIAFRVKLAASNDVDDLRPLLPDVEQALASLRAGEVIRVVG